MALILLHPLVGPSFWIPFIHKRDAYEFSLDVLALAQGTLLETWETLEFAQHWAGVGFSSCLQVVMLPSYDVPPSLQFPATYTDPLFALAYIRAHC